LDLSTPAENVENDLLPFFTHGTHVVVSEAGHIMDLWRSQPDATRRLLQTYIRTGDIDISGFSYKPVSFGVAWGFPVLAKFVVGGAILLIMLVGGVMFYVVRRFRGRRA